MSYDAKRNEMAAVPVLFPRCHCRSDATAEDKPGEAGVSVGEEWTCERLERALVDWWSSGGTYPISSVLACAS